MMRTYNELKKGIADQPRAKIEFRAAHTGWNYRSLMACAGLSGSILAGLAGSLLTATTWFTGAGADSAHMRTLGTILLLITIPLLILGAHGLDLLEKEAEKAKRSHLRLVQGSDHHA